MPVSVNLTAYSPFIPTDADNSGLPLIVLEYTVQNQSEQSLKVSVNGWMQNMSCFQTCGNAVGSHQNLVSKESQYTRVTFSSDQELATTHADWGTMTLAVLDKEAEASANCREQLGTGYYPVRKELLQATAPLGQSLIGGVQSMYKLQKGESHTFTFVLA